MLLPVSIGRDIALLRVARVAVCNRVASVAGVARVAGVAVAIGTLRGKLLEKFALAKFAIANLAFAIALGPWVGGFTLTSIYLETGVSSTSVKTQMYMRAGKADSPL